MRATKKDLSKRFLDFVSDKPTEITLTTSDGVVYTGQLSKIEGNPNGGLLICVENFQRVIKSRHSFEKDTPYGNPFKNYSLEVKVTELEMNCKKAVVKTEMSGEKIEVEVRDNIVEEKTKT